MRAIEPRPLLGRLAVLLSAVALTACSKGPPSDLAPDPGLAARIQSLRIITPQGAACPGGIIRTSYTAVLDDGSEIPFSVDYDSDRPPPLHVIMLSRTSPDATPRRNGDWDARDDALGTAVTGFRLSAFLRVRPSVNGFTTVAPEYSCLHNGFAFRGPAGRRGAAGLQGPDVVVQLGILSSPFYDQLLVAGIEVGRAPPFYVLADANAVPAADWLSITTQGGAGGRGVPGTPGPDGASGRTGCPGTSGGAGGAGGNGGPGGRGGDGGRIIVVAPEEDPYLAGLVIGFGPGGPGGRGGKGGGGGAGGEGGDAETGNRRCSAGSDGPAGSHGADGPDGPAGRDGPPPEIHTVPLTQVFGTRVPPQLAQLIDYERE